MRSNPKSNEGQIRIIGGRWRSRKLHFPAIEGLRPTPDRVRETLFNWLAPIVNGARCLDLFAGSGALGFEALSRGAAHVAMIDQSKEVVAQLRKNAELLQADHIEFYCAQLPPFPSALQNYVFDIVFLDPPFHQNYIAKCVQWLEENPQCLAEEALIYIECESDLDPLPIPDHWQLLRTKKAGEVGYHLVKYGSHHYHRS